MTAGVVVLRAGSLSTRLRIRPMVVSGLLLACAAGLFLVAICAGSTWVEPAKVIDVLGGGGTRAGRFQILELRMPRVAIGALAGAALGLSGALMQSAVRNPLASPDLLGITSGASVGAVGVYVLGWRVFGAPLSVSLPLAALIGGLAAAALVFVISRGGPVLGLRLILVGIGVGAALRGLIYAMLVIGGEFDVQKAQVWMTGDLSTESARIPLLLAAIALTLALGGGLSRSLSSLQLGQEAAHGIGVPVERLMLATLACSVLAASVAVCAAGPLGFVALVSPQVARLMAGGHRPPLICSAACGALLVLAADLVARTLFEGFVSVGVLTALVGGPVLIGLLLSGMRSRT